MSEQRPTITFHIGPGKTGTTSIQTALLGSMASLGEQGVFIPKNFGTNGHLGAAFDYLGRSEGRTIAINARSFVTGLGSECAGSWDRLTQQCTPDRTWVVVSQEVLSVLTTSGVADVVSQFPGFSVRAVAMHRPLSKQIPSMYQQEAMLTRVPDFESYARRCLRFLLSEADHEYRWLDTSWLRRTWQDGGVTLEVVDSTPDISAGALRDVLQNLLPPGVPVPDVPHRNEGLSAYGVDLWREHLDRARPRYLLPGFKAYWSMREMDPWTTDTGVGGSYRLMPEVAHAADGSFPDDGGIDLDTSVGQQWVQRRDAHRDRLASLLHAGDPVTQRVPGTGEGETARRRHTLRRLARQQRRTSALWEVGAQVRRLQRRQTPIRADWSFSDASPQ
jgi:hypothetical protein